MITKAAFQDLCCSRVKTNLLLKSHEALLQKLYHETIDDEWHTTIQFR